ncbi:MAG: hypothetical protein AAFQ98_10340 [Bacteroidota bacterium]
MQPRFQSIIDTIRRQVFKQSGSVDIPLREAIARRVQQHVEGKASEPPPEGLSPHMLQFIDKLAANAYKVVDRDFDHLYAEGYNQDQIFEISVVAATAAGLGRLDHSLNLLNTVET